MIKLFVVALIPMGLAAFLPGDVLSCGELPGGELELPGDGVAGGELESIRLVLPARPDPVVENLGRVFVRHIRSRCDAEVVAQGDASLVLELAIEPGIGAEGFEIADGARGAIRIAGNDPRGLVYGVGKFLHASTYGSRGFTPLSWRGVSVPKMPVRGIYLATHFHNYYQVAPIEEVARYIEDLSLWGANSFLVWFGMEEFHGIDDPKAQAMLDRLRRLLKVAKDLGLDASLGCIGNDGYANSPVHLRAEDSTVGRERYHTRMGERIFNLGNELCPSKPGVPEMELGYAREKFAAFEGIGLDTWFVWPYDNGGCTCSACAPWGANGFLRMAEPLARAYRLAYPRGKVILGTWYFDRWAEGEWEGLAAAFARGKPDWVDYLMADDFGDYPRFPLDRGVPGGLPLLNFPEISMWGQDPWGGYGANPFPGRLQARWDEVGKKLSGGFPYSEGIYEDLNKAICLQLYWAPDRPAVETVKEYIASEFSPEVVDDVLAVVRLFEKNHERDRIDESAVEAYRSLERAEVRLSPRARASWRWRLFRIRAAIDQELYRNRLGRGRSKVFRAAYEELMELSHAGDARSMLRPVLLPAVDVEGPRLLSGYAEAVRASKPLAWWRMGEFQGREVEDATGHGHRAFLEEAASLGPPGDPSKDVQTESGPRAACFFGGRLKAALEGLGDEYSVEFWFHNTLPNTVRPVTGYIFSRGREGPEGTPGDDLGLSGTSSPTTVPPGRLFVYNGDAARQAVGKTEIAPDTWNHIVFVREGRRIAVHLNGNSVPEISAEMEKGYPEGATQIFLGGRNDGFGGLQGKIAEAAVYARALSGEEAARHHEAAGFRE